MNDKLTIHGSIWSCADNIYLDVFNEGVGWKCECLNDILRQIPENSLVTINIEIHDPVRRM